MKKRAGLLGVVLSVAAIAVFSLAVSVTEGQPVGGGLILDVVVDFDTFHVTGFPGAFNVEGDTGSGAGTFQCWGWIMDDDFGTANVSQVYNITGRGAIMTQGGETESAEPLAIVGGTGDFRNVRGEAFVEWTDVGFTITFDLKGAGP